jgi:hypothetical protein
MHRGHRPIVKSPRVTLESALGARPGCWSRLLSAGEIPRASPPPDPYDPSPVRVPRVRCESLDSTRVLDSEVLRRENGYVHFRVVLMYRPTYLYARRPGDHGNNHGRDFGPK